MDSEEPVFEAVLNWVKHNRKEREPYLPDMLEFVRMPLLTPRYITDVIDAEVSRRHTPTAAAAAGFYSVQYDNNYTPSFQLNERVLTYLLERAVIIKACFDTFQPLIRCSLPCRDLVDEAKKFHLRPELRSEMQGPRTQARLGEGPASGMQFNHRYAWMDSCV